MTTTVTIKGTQMTFTATQINDMKEWIADCSWGEDDFDVEDLTPTEIVRGVNRHFEGGVNAFLLAA